MTIDKNHAWDKMRFVKISHFSVMYDKNYSKITRLTSLVFGSNLQSFTEKSLKRYQKKIRKQPGDMG